MGCWDRSHTLLSRYLHQCDDLLQFVFVQLYKCMSSIPGTCISSGWNMKICIYSSTWKKCTKMYTAFTVLYLHPYGYIWYKHTRIHFANTTSSCLNAKDGLCRKIAWFSRECIWECREWRKRERGSAARQGPFFAQLTHLGISRLKAHSRAAGNIQPTPIGLSSVSLSDTGHKINPQPNGHIRDTYLHFTYTFARILHELMPILTRSRPHVATTFSRSKTRALFVSMKW